MKKVDGQEVIMDLKGVDPKWFHKKYFDKYIQEAIKLTKMRAHGKPIYWYDIHDSTYLQGTSVVQLLTTSSLTIHSFKNSKSVFINMFTCKFFDKKKLVKYTKEFFKPKSMKSRNIMRYS